MKCLLSVCLIGAATVVTILQSGMISSSQPMARGVSVEMASARSAQSEPEADKAEAWVVTVTQDDRLFIGSEPVSAAKLKQWMMEHPRKRDAKLYIKADAHAAFASVEEVLEIARAMQFEMPVLLTAHAGTPAHGTLVSPTGIDVWVNPAMPSGAIATVVRLLPSGQKPSLLVNNDRATWSDLESTLGRHFEKGDDKVVLLKAAAGLPYAEVVRAIDSCRAAGAKVYMAESGV